MSHSYPSSSITATNPTRRSAGLIFVVALHLAAIAAIKSGLVVSMHMVSIPPVHVMPTFNKPEPQPIPIDPVIPKFTSNIKITTQMPTVPIIDTSPADENKPEATQIRGSTEPQQYAETNIITARVDPSRPLAQPMYPAASRRANEEGRVELMLYILADGRVGDARIAQSSGHLRLDDAARHEAMRSWRFIPQQTDGVATPSWQRFAITFRLEK